MRVTLETLERLTQLPAPIVGLPRRAGEMAWAFPRKKLAGLIAGLNGDTVCKWEGTTERPQQLGVQNQNTTPLPNPYPVLIVESEGGRRRYRLLGQDMSCETQADAQERRNYRTLERWAQSQKKSKARESALPQDKMARKAARHREELEKRLGVLGRKAEKVKPARPHNPVVDEEYWGRDGDARGIEAWREQKEQRRAVGLLAVKFGGLKNGCLPSTRIRKAHELYAALQGLMGHPITKYGEIHETRWRSKPTEQTYLCQLYQHCGLDEKPSVLGEGRDSWRVGEEERRPRERREYCDRMREYRNMQEEMGYLRQQIESLTLTNTKEGHTQ